MTKLFSSPSPYSVRKKRKWLCPQCHDPDVCVCVCNMIILFSKKYGRSPHMFGVFYQEP